MHWCWPVANRGLLPLPAAWRWLKSQRGVFSPFMFGLLMAVSVFSVLSAYWAKKDLIRLEEARVARAKNEAQDIAKAVEFAIRTETTQTFGNNLDLATLRQYAAQSQGQTRGGDDVKIVTRDSDQQFDLINQRIAIAATDDPLEQSELQRAGDAEALSDVAETAPIVVIDTGAIRESQIKKSRDRLEQMAEQVYQFFAANLRFPTETEYDELQNLLGLKDVWGGDFQYTYRNDEEAVLEFTTPWNYTHSIKLDLENN